MFHEIIAQKKQAALIDQRAAPLVIIHYIHIADMYHRLYRKSPFRHHWKMIYELGEQKLGQTAGT